MATNSWRHWAGGLVIWIAGLGVAPLAMAQDPPGRVARMTLPDLSVQWARSGESEWQSIEPNWPLTSGDRIRLPTGGRTELHAGAHVLRLQGPAQLEIAALDDATMRLVLSEGSLNLTVRDLPTDERVEVNTGNLAMVVGQAGEYRIDADPAGDTTQVAVRTGAATVFGENAESAPIAINRLVRYVGRRLTAVANRPIGPRDGLDQWAADRNRAEERSVSAQHVSRDVVGYQELDANGDWVTDATYGTVWYPRVVAADWAPYRHGQWRWVDPWGWTWIDDARWGFAPFHYGRWVQTGPRWGWVPGPRTRRPAYAPALVGFAGAPLPRPPAFGHPHAPGVDWFPLAPGEAWRSPFGGSQHYVDRVNRGWARPGIGQAPGYVHQRRPEVDPSPRHDLRPDLPIRSTQRERSPISAGPGPQFGPVGPQPQFGPAGPGPQFGPVGPGPQFGPAGSNPSRIEQERRDRWQRDNQQRQQQWQDQQRQEQQQREWSARQHQRQLQDQLQLQQQRELQDRQRQQMQEPSRQHERFMREQQEAQQRMLRDQQAAQQQMQRQQQQQQQMPQPRMGRPDGGMSDRPRNPEGVRSTNRERGERN